MLFRLEKENGVTVKTQAVSGQGLARDVSDDDSRDVVVLPTFISSPEWKNTKSHLVGLNASESHVEVG